MENKTKHSFFKKALSLLLTVVMVFGYAGLLSGLIGNDLLGTKQTAEAAVGDQLTFIVPEAIYLYPDAVSADKATATPFQYYVNNDSSGSAEASFGTTGSIYYSFSGASSASLSYSFVDSSFNALSGGSVTLSSSTISSGSSVTINGGSSPSLAASTTGCYLLWTLSYTDSADGMAKKAYALSYVYKPFVYPVAASADGGTGGTANWAGNVTWISGVHSITGQTTSLASDWDDKWTNRYTYASNFSAFISRDDKAYVDGAQVTGSQAMVTSGFSSNSGNTNWYASFYNVDKDYKLEQKYNHNGSGYGDGSSGAYKSPAINYIAAKYKKNTENIQACVLNNSYGNIYIDVSRYSNLNQIPNLAVGMMVIDNENAESDNSNGHWYIADYTGRTPSGYDDWHSGADQRGNFYDDHGAIIAAQTTKATCGSYASKEGIRYAGAWPRELVGSTTTQGGTGDYMVKGFFGDEDKSWGTWYYASSHCIAKLKATYYDKTTLRSAVQNAIKHFPLLGVNGISGGNITSCYFNASFDSRWAAFQSAFTAAYTALTKVDGTIADPDTLAASLNNALAALKTRTYYNLNYSNINTNLWAPELLASSHNGVSCSYNETTGVITLNGTQTASTGNLMRSEFKPEVGTYRVTVELVGGSKTAGNGCVVLDMSKNDGSNTSTRLNTDFNGAASKSITFDSTTASECTQIRLWVWHNSTANVFSNLQFRVKVEKASSATAMSPAGQWTGTLGSATATSFSRSSFPDKPTRTGYTFKGWSTSASATSGNLNSSGNYTAISVLGCCQTLYAIWSPN
ncbi:MAG: InlB B-repeat-containing protein, partial [Clostridia bacterium]|nr:InlB B-repeat-containing protein [Clostridia bacterium]